MAVLVLLRAARLIVSASCSNTQIDTCYALALTNRLHLLIPICHGSLWAIQNCDPRPLGLPIPLACRRASFEPLLDLDAGPFQQACAAEQTPKISANQRLPVRHAVSIAKHWAERASERAYFRQVLFAAVHQRLDIHFVLEQQLLDPAAFLARGECLRSHGRVVCIIYMHTDSGYLAGNLRTSAKNASSSASRSL